MLPTPAFEQPTYSATSSIDLLFRRESGRLVSILTRRLGASYLELAQDAVQEAFVRAMINWQFKGIPTNPTGWLYLAAKNYAIDRLRAHAKRSRIDDELIRELLSSPPPNFSDSITTVINVQKDHICNDQLRLMFLCCNPVLSVDSQVTLTLKALCGFSTHEIALGLRANPETVAKRVTRAQKSLVGAAFELPPASELTSRVGVVLNVLYLLFSEGYSPHSGPNAVQKYLCQDAIYLCSLLSQHPIGNLPQIHALLGLMLLQSSRSSARTRGDGELQLLENQDRSTWDQDMIMHGMQELKLAQAGNVLTRYHVEAGIAALHATAESYEATNWTGIVDLYNILMEQWPSNIVALNRVAAISVHCGPDQGSAELLLIRDDPNLQKWHLFHALDAHLKFKLKDISGAVKAYTQALKCPCNDRERDFLNEQIRNIQDISTQ